MKRTYYVVRGSEKSKRGHARGVARQAEELAGTYWSEGPRSLVATPPWSYLLAGIKYFLYLLRFRASACEAGVFQS